MIRRMCSLTPSERLTSQEHLTNEVFPEWFEELHSYLAQLNDLPSSSSFPSTQAPLSSTASLVNQPIGQTKPQSMEHLSRKDPILRNESDEKIERLIADWDSIVQMLGVPNEGCRRFDIVKEGDQAVLQANVGLFPLRLGIPGWEVLMPVMEEGSAPKMDGTSSVGLWGE